MQHKHLTICGRLLKVYEDGRIYRESFTTTRGHNMPGRFLKPSHSRTGSRITFYENSKHRTILVHRIIAEAFLPDFDKELQVDHIDGDRTNNHVSNLRMATNQENARGFQSPRGGTSFYRGVGWHKGCNKWVARVCDLDGRDIHLGVFDCEHEAAKTVNQAMLSYGYKREALNLIQP